MPPLAPGDGVQAGNYLDERGARGYEARHTWDSVTIRVRPTKLIEFPGMDAYSP